MLFRSRQSLRGVVLIMDARHPLGVLDYQLLDWLKPTGVPVHVLLSKADKLGRQESLATLQKVSAALKDLDTNYSAQLFSSPRKIGILEAGKLIGGWLDPRNRNKKPPV